MNEHSPYIGRFAPSATGHLHLGSLVTAIACALEAHQRGGLWIVRIDDIDPLRSSIDSINSIKKSIETFFTDLPPQLIRLQTERQHTYRSALRKLIDQRLVYSCGCSRKLLQDSKTDFHHCRSNVYQGPDPELKMVEDVCYRFLNPTNQAGNLSEDSVLYRRDHCYAYHLTCVVDDQLDNVTHIIRGADLIHAEQPQTTLIQALEYNQVSYDYVPLVKTVSGLKLSKQHHAPPILTSNMTAQQCQEKLGEAFSHFNWLNTQLSATSQSPPMSLQRLWGWAKEHWSLSINRYIE